MAKKSTRTHDSSGVSINSLANALQVARIDLYAMIRLLKINPVDGRTAAGRLARLLSPSQVAAIKKAMVGK
jgi:hypothetical protein